MGPRHQLTVGFVLLAAGLVVVAIGTVLPAADPVVALGYLLAAPMLVSFCGTIVVVVALARSITKARRSAPASRTVGLSAVAGLGLYLGYGVAGILSQVPDSLAGLNGPYVSGPAPGIAAFELAGFGLFAGLVIGAVIALVWRTYRRRHETSAR
jgi:hypothetical protein